MRDLTQLTTALADDLRYDADVIAGRNRNLLALLNAENSAGTNVWHVLTRNEVIKALGLALRSMNADRVMRLRLLLDGEEGLDATIPEIRAELLEVVPVAARPAFQTAVQRKPTYAEELNVVDLGLSELWAALRQVPKSYLAKYLEV